MEITPLYHTKEDLYSALALISKTPEPAVQADKNGIAFYHGITMIYGEAKLGKSFTVADALRGSNAVFVDIDNNGDELHQHLLKNDLLPLHGYEAMPFVNMIMQYDGAERLIIVIDSFANLAIEMGCNFNDAMSIASMFKRLRKITEKGHSLILIHHVTTNGKAQDSEEYSAKIQGNAGALYGQIDVTYTLKSRGVLMIDKSRISNATALYISENAQSIERFKHAEVPK